jgi:hypothetical protein
MEKKIDLWCNRWLSLGGRFILVKSTLESLHVYWMSLATIPCTILNKIRIIMFNFLWRGNMDSFHFHLCRWDTLAKPKSYGGWGFRNIFHFSKSLATNTLWRVLMGVGIWHEVIKDKYLPSTTIINWLRSPTFNMTTVSKIWGGLLKSIHLITQWLSWIPGSGHLVALGRDKILGLDDRSILSPELVSFLRQNKISVLSQARNLTEQVGPSTSWYRYGDLGLSGSLAVEWECYRMALISAGASIHDGDDTLMWTGGDWSQTTL